jgi:hypothetical protein
VSRVHVTASYFETFRFYGTGVYFGTPARTLFFCCCRSVRSKQSQQIKRNSLCFYCLCYVALDPWFFVVGYLLGVLDAFIWSCEVSYLYTLEDGTELLEDKSDSLKNYWDFLFATSAVTYSDFYILPRHLPRYLLVDGFHASSEREQLPHSPRNNQHRTSYDNQCHLTQHVYNGTSTAHEQSGAGQESLYKGPCQ